MKSQLGRLRIGIQMLWLAAGMSGCVAIPNGPFVRGRQIPVGPGTEDMVIDDHGPQPRILISCADRRSPDQPTFGSVCSYDLSNGRVDTLAIKEYPHNTAFNPHGMDLQQIDQHLHLFLVCHDDTSAHHWIADFLVDGNDLLWVRNYHAGLLTSPNGVCATPEGHLYVTNDHFERGNNTESFFKKRIATVVHFQPDGTHEVAYKGIAYGNGITCRDGYVYVAATVENAVYRFKVLPDGKLSKKTIVAKVKGPDNLRWDGDDLLVACHLRLLKFLGHAKSAKKLSPTAVYRIVPGSTKPVALYGDKGGTIPAGSTALIWRDRLFVSQVFENWIVEVKK